MSTLTVVDLLRKLSGPSTSENDIKWVEEVPAGRRIVQWLTDEWCSCGPEGLALTQAALESEELDIYNRAGAMPSFVPTMPARPYGVVTAPDLPSSGIRSQSLKVARQIERSQEYQRRIGFRRGCMETLKLRCQPDATGKLDLAVSENVRKAEDELKAASIQIDNAIVSLSNALNQVLTLLLPPEDALRPGTPAFKGEDCAVLANSPQTSCVHAFQCDRNVQGLFGFLEGLLSCVHRWYEQIEPSLCLQPPSYLLTQDAARLATNFSELVNSDVRYVWQIEGMISSLDSGTSSDDLLFEPDLAATSPDGIWPHLADAWKHDQIQELVQMSMLLAELARCMQKEILAPAILLHSILAYSDDELHNIWALLEATSDELEDFDPDGLRLENHSIGTASFSGKEFAVIGILKAIAALRSPGTPFTVVDQSDMLREVTSLRAETTGKQETVLQWTRDLKCSLTSFLASIKPLQSALYMNSPMPTMPPLGHSDELRSLEQQAISEIERMRNEIDELQKTMGWDDRTRLKVASFVQAELAR